MKCPKCNKDGVKYDIQKNKHIKRKDSRNSAKKRKASSGTQHQKSKPREDYNATCKCGWKGIIYDEIFDKPQILPEKPKERW